MKTKNLILVASIAMTMVLSSCGLRGLINSVEKIAEEEEEILDGKLFTIAKGTIVYEDGTTIQFEENGKIQYHQTTKDGEIQIFNGNKLYTLDPVSKTYEENDLDGYNYPAILAGYVVMEAAYEFGDHLDKYSSGYKMTQGTKTISGQTCKTYTIIDEDDKDVIGSWNRVLVYKEEDDMVDVQAVVIKSSVDKSIMSILNDYKKVEEE